MSADRRIDAFLTLANRGLRSARILLRDGQFEDAALFVHQVVERVARALLIREGVPFGTSHNLGQMAHALSEGHSLKDRIRAFDDLSSAVTAYRYPTSSGRLQPPPERDELIKKLEAAEQRLRDAQAYISGAGKRGA